MSDDGRRRDMVKVGGQLRAAWTLDSWQQQHVLLCSCRCGRAVVELTHHTCCCILYTTTLANHTLCIPTTSHSEQLFLRHAAEQPLYARACMIH